MMAARLLHVAAVLLGSASLARAECGGAGEPCATPLGSYNVVAPAYAPGDLPRPAIVHFPGAGVSGADALGDKGMVVPSMAHGYVFIAPNGLPRGNLRTGWRFRPQDTGGRDELAFIREVLADAETRFHIDRSRVLLTGFSIGGSLVWYLACRAPNEFAAYAPVSGGFWDPLPQSCAGPIKMLHTHGWQDRTVPLEGRPLGNLGVRQGDIFAGLQVWRSMNGCAGVRPDEFDTGGFFWRRRWTTCAPGTALEFALHPGGHEIPAEWAPMAIAWFEKQVPVAHAAR